MIREIRITNRAIKLCYLSMVIALFSCGCASDYMSAYMKDRDNDALDVFSVTAGIGLGAKVRVSCFNAGELSYGEATGLRGGSLIPQKFIDAWSPDLETTVIGFQDYENKDGRGKTFHSMTICGVGILRSEDPKTHNMSFFDYNYEIFPVYYFTQIEVIFALGAGFRLGFNPGELIDFIVGWTTIDIFNDDKFLTQFKKQESVKALNLRDFESPYAPLKVQKDNIDMSVPDKYAPSSDGKQDVKTTPSN